MSDTPKGLLTPRWLYVKIRDIFGADLRSLAAFRMVLALLVLFDIARRFTDLSAHYAADGILPRPVLIEELLSPSRFSLNLANGSTAFQAFLFGVLALTAFGMLVGYRTRLMTVIVWALLLSIQNRNPLLLNAGDLLLVILLFWAIFLPLGAYWSIDRVLQTPRLRLSMRFLSFATLGLFLQIAFVYWFTAVLKWSNSAEWRDGTALYYALSIERLPTPIGAYLHQFPKVLVMLTLATLALEALGPFLLFSPFFTGPLRTGAVLAFVSLHSGIWLTMHVGLFPFVSALCMVCFLPPWFWDKAAMRFHAMVPELPNSMRQTWRTLAIPLRSCWLYLRAHLSSEGGAGRYSVANLGVRSGRNIEEGYAARTTSPLDLKTASTGDKSELATEARDDREISDGTVPRSEPVMLRSAPVTNLLAALLLLWVFCCNLATISEFDMPERASSPGFFLGLAQRWSMFAPPSKEGGWHIIPGTLRGGQRVDLMPVTHNDFRLYEVAWEKPHHVAAIYKNDRWNKYMASIVQDENEDVRPWFGAYICKEWNARHEGSEELVTFQIVYMVEETLPNYRHDTPQKMVLSDLTCS